MTINWQTTVLIFSPLLTDQLKMQAILLYSFILTFSYGFAEDKIVPNPVDNIFPSMYVKKFSSAEDNHVPSSKNDDCNCANMDDILKERKLC